MIDRTMKYNLIYYEIFIYDKLQYEKERDIFLIYIYVIVF